MVHSCIETYSYSCFNPLSNEPKSIFKSGDLHANKPRVMMLYAESAADQTDHFNDALFRENVTYSHDVVETL